MHENRNSVASQSKFDDHGRIGTVARESPTFMVWDFLESVMIGFPTAMPSRPASRRSASLKVWRAKLLYFEFVVSGAFTYKLVVCGVLSTLFFGFALVLGENWAKTRLFPKNADFFHPAAPLRVRVEQRAAKTPKV